MVVRSRIYGILRMGRIGGEPRGSVAIQVVEFSGSAFEWLKLLLRQRDCYPRIKYGVAMTKLKDPTRGLW